jgi:hypothetical protein
MLRDSVCRRGVFAFTGSGDRLLGGGEGAAGGMRLIRLELEMIEGDPVDRWAKECALEGSSEVGRMRSRCCSVRRLEDL